MNEEQKKEISEVLNILYKIEDRTQYNIKQIGKSIDLLRELL